ncbi:sugar ABC transporter ATP-binding protein [Tanticharoenia sakaeratensis]|uniref:Ribose ABC transporter ATP-binding protein rbsA n=1 Tax=Tanticharoenia sakaeratensis NBRC 103193 TaxID=1231623 RepID=A0A0D6MKZ5_9PROT|nr:sugar ABC transporter ATP-binding protein [Tanticharoenia sakaeratensis]GAN53948.1 ribose ABC transporter ATP-binding protein rbsA [Tanticharoenia sakaeratensis NBRC 103193]GBQ25337.1 ribose ABC transporter ATP-binding protein [Tanticharoenia sakaeratensis NBRC 103193]
MTDHPISQAPDDNRSDPETPALEMQHISKSFPGVRALSDVSLRAYGGEVLALMGENGAGKSTLMKILSGAYSADPGGEIRINGRRVSIDSPLAARAAGIAIIYQELALAPNLTVAENIYLGNEPKRRGMMDRAGMNAASAPLLERLGVPFGPETIVSSLSVAEQQLVEIARSLHRKSSILILDEPTTALSSRETERLFALVRQLREEGIALIYISHRMAEVDELADRVAVLRDGCAVGTLARHELSRAAIVHMMVGRDLSGFYVKHRDPLAVFNDVVMDVQHLSDHAGRVRDCSLTLHRGEVLGLAGLVGAGRTELARLIFGAEQPKSGRIILDGMPFAPRRPRDALDRGIAYLTEDRKALGLFLDMSCAANINLGVIEQDARGGVLDRKHGRARAKNAFSSLGVRAASPIVSVGGLSGGNQQKVLLGRLLETGPKVLILDEPTRGVDIGAKAEIYRLIGELAAKGLAILVISSEMPEIVGLCDRVLVMREGTIMGEVGGNGAAEITQEAIMEYAAGIAA